MNHWIQKKKDREIAQCYAEYDNWEELAWQVASQTKWIPLIFKSNNWKKIAEGYCPPPKHTNSC